jgi:tetratricopeptide (TPR) repeat protein
MKPDTIYKFVQELKRRRVIRGIIVYGASTLLLLEAADNIANAFGQDAAPEWFVWLLGAGFFISLWFSWIYDITPGGIRKTEPESEVKVPIPKKEVRLYQTTTFVSILLIVGILTYKIIDNAMAEKIKALDKSIAVLPFNNPSLSHNQALTYEFIGQELTTCLTKVKDYTMIPWDDCRIYQRRDKSYSDMGYDLGVALVVVWKVYKIEIAEKLSIELITVDDGKIRWSQSFSVKGNWETEICRISRRISKKITRELRTYLTPQERALIERQDVPATANFHSFMGKASAQDAWTQSNTGMTNQGKEKNAFTDSISFSSAIRHFTKAIEEDPDFAEAYANRAKARLMGIRAKVFDKSVLEESLEDINRAIELNPDLPEAIIAMGFYYFYGIEQLNLAAVQFEKACELSPANTEYMFYRSKIYTALGNWRQAQVLSDRVLDAKPHNALYYSNMGLTFAYLDQFSKALHCQDRAIYLFPRWSAPYINKAYTQAFRGKIADARSTVLDAEIQTGFAFPRLLAELDLYVGDFSSAVVRIEQASKQEHKKLEEDTGDAFLIQAKIYFHAGSTGLAKKYYSQAADFFKEQIELQPEEPLLHSKLALAYAGLGNDKLAIENGQKAYKLIKENYNGFDFPFILYKLVLTYTLAEDKENALNTLQELLNSHSLYTLDFIRKDPDLKPLLNDPEFKNVNP